MSNQPKRIAVIFGGESVEHDVSILTGLQFLEAMDLERYEGFPVYVAPDGGWWTGEALLKRSFYPLSEEKKKSLKAVRLEVGARSGDSAALVVAKGGLFGGRHERIPFHLMVPAIHGSNGEDGTLQGLLAFHGVPFAGCRTLAASATMNKDFTKRVAAAIGVPVLPHALITRPDDGTSAGLELETIEAALTAGLGATRFPLFVKPVGLGSSIGVAVANDMDGLMAALLAVFRMDSAAIIEPKVANLREYNVAVSRATGTLRLSAVEQPESAADYLDFSEKYLAGGSGGAKLDEVPSEGMLSQNRILNPELSAEQAATISTSAIKAFETFGLSGSVRIDFLSDGESGKVWFNEINTVPGSFAFYLWQAAEPPLSFMDLTSALIEEGLRLSKGDRAVTDVKTGRAAIFDHG